MTAKLAGPVGKSTSTKANQLPDVMLVQMLLNNHILFDTRLVGHLGRKALVADGRINRSDPTDATITAIIIFQREIMGFKAPDGRVDPVGKTLQALAGPIGSIIPPPAAPSTPKPSTAPNHSPVRVKNEAVQKLRFSGSHEVVTSLGTLRISSGDIFKAVDGERLVLGIVAMDVAYLMIKRQGSDSKPGVFAQHVAGFTTDVTLGAAATDIVKRTSAIQTAMRAEFHFLAGIACSANFLSGMLYLTMSIGDWVRENRKHFPVWQKQYTALAAARRVLMHHAPALYEELYWKLMADVAGNLWSSFTSDPNDVAFRSGEVFGGLGKIGYGSAATVLSALVKVLFPAVKAAVVSIPGAAVISAKDLANQIQQAFVLSGRILSPIIAGRISAEVLGNAKELQTVLKDLHAAFAEGA